MSDRWVYNDGGRAEAGYEGEAKDCVTRAIAIALEMPYQAAYDAMKIARENPVKASPATRRMLMNSSPRTGIHKHTYDAFLKDLGWVWTPTMFIGSGCQVHLLRDELPSGRLICRVSRHLVAVIDGVIHDTHDSSYSRWSGAGKRAVYGYYSKP